MDEPRRRQATAKAITGLAAIAGRPGGSDQLERLMLETLGLVTNRLDAWATSVHTSRLASCGETTTRQREGSTSVPMA